MMKTKYLLYLIMVAALFLVVEPGPLLAVEESATFIVG